MWPLTYLGGDDVRDVFINTIESELGQRQDVTDDEVRVLREAVLVIGVLAAVDNHAFDYLTQHYKIYQWHGSRRWEPVEGMRPSPDLLLQDAALIALGASGREQAREILDGLRLVGGAETADMAHAMVSATFYFALVSEHGTSIMYELYGIPELLVAEYKNWKATPSGAAMVKWRDRVLLERK